MGRHSKITDENIKNEIERLVVQGRSDVEIARILENEHGIKITSATVGNFKKRNLNLEEILARKQINIEVRSKLEEIPYREKTSLQSIRKNITEIENLKDIIKKYPVDKNIIHNLTSLSKLLLEYKKFETEWYREVVLSEELGNMVGKLMDISLQTLIAPELSDERKKELVEKYAQNIKEYGHQI